MDSKLMLVFTFTTIVVVAGYPSDPYTDFAALLSPAKSQTITYEDCFYLTFAPQVRFCLKYYFSESNIHGYCWTGLREELKECTHPGSNCLTFTAQKGLSEVGKFEVCTLIDGTHCYYDPSPPVCEPGYKHEAVQNSLHMEQEDICICMEAEQKICSPRGCDDKKELHAPLTKEIADELRKQVELGRNKSGQVEVQATSSEANGQDYNYPELSHESTVALQFMQRHHWLSCPSTTCGGGICPEHCFEESDWTHCWGQVFRMYRAAGPGNILNGDFVGLYYVHENKWFSMWEGLPHKATCPGNPSSASGFQEYLKWFKCAGEVFQVYAKGKPIGAKIIDQDIISLYYPADVHHVVFSNEVSLSRCMLWTSQFNLNLLATTQPFDDCENMGVYITIKRLPPE